MQGIKKETLRKTYEFWGQNRILVLLLVIEVLIIGNSLFASLKEPVCYTFTPDQLEDIATDAAIRYDENGRRGVTEFATAGQDILQTPEMTLAKGHYKVTFDYQSVPTMVEGGLLHHSNIQLKAWENPMAVENATGILSEKSEHAQITFAVNYTINGARILFHDDGGIFTIGSVTIRQDQIYAMAITIWLFLFCIALDFAIVLFCPRSFAYCGKETSLDVLIIAGLILASSVPLLADGMGPRGDDWAFHIQRIEGIVQGLKEGQFPVRVYSMAKDGYGYSSSLFYGEAFLYFPAILRLMGVSIQGAYKSYVVLINAITACLSFWCFLKIFGQRNIARLGSALYTLSHYRLVNLYTRTAVGEYTAMTFLPLVVYGLWLLYAQTDRLKEHKNVWILLAAAFSAILQSHMITMELTCLCTLVCCLLMWKKTFRPQVLRIWVKAVAATVLANLWFLVPFLSALSTGLYSAIQATGVQEGGITPAMLFAYDNRPTIGAALLAGSGAFLYCLTAIGRDEGKEWKLGLFALGFGGFACAASTNWFPWNETTKLGVIGICLRVIQFPWRYLSVATVALTVVTLCAARILAKTHARNFRRAAGICLAVTCLSVWMFYSQTIPQMETAYLGDPSQIMYQNPHTNLAYSMDNLYIPETAKATMNDFQSDAPTNVQINKISRENGILLVDCAVVDPTREGYMEVPLLYYPGYRVLNEDTPTFLSDHGLVGVVVPAGYSGTLQVAFREPKRWRLADLISLITILGIACRMVCRPVQGAGNKKRLSI